jgi:hypothetical protein
MGYFILVIGQTVVLPIVSGAIQLAVGGGDPVLVLGIWWVFWGVGTRLFVARRGPLSGRPRRLPVSRPPCAPAR